LNESIPKNSSNKQSPLRKSLTMKSIKTTDKLEVLPTGILMSVKKVSKKPEESIRWNDVPEKQPPQSTSSTVARKKSGL